MSPDLEPFLILILPQIISPVTTRRKISRLKTSQRFVEAFGFINWSIFDNLTYVSSAASGEHVSFNRC